ncbi:MAG: polysaccharide deacetylase family protein [Deltaproteobacteria bacterium]|nr:polysaccharide deacetylase family protein [Deltaproteobacteria bacterium]MBI2974488.1 polysaccharide deacetylase family protein [Deltaproteobacteria bacterium]
MRVFITVDVEEDCPPFAKTCRGINEGMPKLLGLLKEANIPATFFATAEIAGKYPDAIDRLVASGHELGCHGNRHIRLDRADSEAVRHEIAEAAKTLRRFYKVTSFRAPYLQFPRRHLKILADNGFRLDSSEAKHKNPLVRPSLRDGIFCVPASTTSIVLRMPSLIRNSILSCLRDPVVLFVHPWEYVNLQKEHLRFDCKFRTGDIAFDVLRETICFFKDRGAVFLRMEELDCREFGR